MHENVVVQVSLPAGTYRAIEAAASREHRTTAEVVSEAIERYVQQVVHNPLVGLFANEPELMDALTEDAMQTRESSPLRDEDDCE